MVQPTWIPSGSPAALMALPISMKRFDGFAAHRAFSTPRSSLFESATTLPWSTTLMHGWSLGSVTLAPFLFGSQNSSAVPPYCRDWTRVGAFVTRSLTL